MPCLSSLINPDGAPVAKAVFRTVEIVLSMRGAVDGPGWLAPCLGFEIKALLSCRMSTLGGVHANPGRFFRVGSGFRQPFDSGGARRVLPARYEVNGKQYIAVMSGRPSAFWAAAHSGAPTAFVFAIPEPIE